MRCRFIVEKFSDPKIIKFLSVGILNTVFGYSIYAALLFFKASYLIALFIATVAGVVFNYFSFGKIVFSGHQGWFIFFKFLISYSITYAVNAVLLEVLTREFILSPYIGQVICIPLSVVISWVLMNYWVYKKD